jgi:hypothetical protein
VTEGEAYRISGGKHCAGGASRKGGEVVQPQAPLIAEGSTRSPALSSDGSADGVPLAQWVLLSSARQAVAEGSFWLTAWPHLPFKG